MQAAGRFRRYDTARQVARHGVSEFSASGDTSSSIVVRVPGLEDGATEPVARGVDAIGHRLALRRDDGLAHTAVGCAALALHERQGSQASRPDD